MNFINNYAAQVALASGVTELALALPNGTYRLTLSDARGADATRFEYLDAAVVSGIATLTRGREGSADQDWPDGSWIYYSITAGVLDQVFATLDAQAELIAAQAIEIAGLGARVSSLESANIPENAVRVTLGVVESGESSYRAGYFEPDGEGGGFIGGVQPVPVMVAGVGELSVFYATALYEEFEDAHEFNIAFAGNVVALLSAIDSIDVQGIGTLPMAGSYSWNPDSGITQANWVGNAADWISGGARLITFNPA